MTHGLFSPPADGLHHEPAEAGVQTLTVATSSRVEMIDITDKVAEAIRKEGVADGIAVVFVPHTTAGLTINENADPDVVRDMVMETNKIVPVEDGYRHTEGNAAAHVKSTLYGPSLALVVSGGRPVLGTWQAVYFCEFDGPRRRTVHVAAR
jgi:secondary thiamine-phosphate synthase enzyme